LKQPCLKKGEEDNLIDSLPFFVRGLGEFLNGFLDDMAFRSK
jgi:hypothetical protein